MLGAYADRHGRKASLMVSIVLMTFGTLAIAFMPGYETIGIFAPIAVLIAPLVQGFSAGGEFGSSTGSWSSIDRIAAASSQAGNLRARG